MILGGCRFLGVPDNGRVWAGGYAPLALSFLYLKFSLNIHYTSDVLGGFSMLVERG